MKKVSILFSALALMAFTSCNDGKKKEEKQMDQMEKSEKTDIDQKMNQEKKDMNDGTSMTITLEPKSESSASGKVSFTQKDGMVMMKAKISGLTPGTHAIHIHENADCSAPDGKSAGGHWNPTFENHGKWGSSDGYHKGDIGNMEADENGNATISMQTDEWCIGCDDENKNIVGKGIIVHGGADDFTSQPSGAAGARVLCGGVIQ
ncbi:superoxide dismutase family protein [Marixanthomonas sp. SCSIO 43207]|uniref:superoxide dismutase family protein n=1 Tax=Marixanthomonas sp. SCSIO 43207 TaxID=2779360 RepID=UPI001CA9199D|nr:superoxide dismutase family protein [Marixanthomonas sp. SCSIO 43207]UAB81053.1 superoxide dismutase family protein [Marixanthomonas sp. SCSIO 43207]